MAKTTKAERKAFDALDEAAAAAKTAKKVAADLPAESSGAVRIAAKKAKDAAKTSKKAVRKHPRKVRRRAEKATEQALTATEAAIAGTEQQAHEDAAQEPTDAVVPTPDQPEELALLTVAALRKRAKSQGRVGYSRLSKARLVEFLS